MPFGPGETFERYAIEALIGRGGMGEVYRAVDTRLRRKVALKVIRPDKERPDAAARLYREARAAAALTHPNAVAVHDIGEAEGVFYVVMELVVGQPLLAFVGDPRVTFLKKVGWITDVARALAAAHRAGIIHRDVKPSNVMVSDDGFAKVLDFGLARPLGPIDPVSFRTQEGRVLGTLRYMAPEQVVGAEADARSDQYAFGLTAYELLSGTHPGGAMFDTQPKRIDEIATDVPAEIALVIERTLARDSTKRYASMDDVVHALEGAISTQRAPPPYMTPPPLVAAAPIGPETAETISAAMPVAAPAAEDPARAPTLAALAEAGSRDPARAKRQDATLISKEAPSALVRAPRDAPLVQTLPLAVPAPRVVPSPPTPQTLTSGPPPSTPPMPVVAPPAPIVIASAPPPRHASGRPPPASSAPADNRTMTIVISVAVLAVAAFAGTYLGSQRSITPSPVTVTSSNPPASPSVARAASALVPGRANSTESQSPAGSASVASPATASIDAKPAIKVPPKATGGSPGVMTR